MIIAAVCLGALPSLGNSFVCAAVGYVTEASGCTSSFFKVLLTLHAASVAAICVQDRYDGFFDEKYSTRWTYRFRVYTLGGLLLTLVACFGLVLAKRVLLLWDFVAVLAVVAALGFSSGALTVSAAVLVGEIRVKNLLWVWLGVSVAGITCIVVKFAIGFESTSSPHEVRAFFLTGTAIGIICLTVFAVLDVGGRLDKAYDSSGRPSALSPLTGGSSDLRDPSPRPWRAWLQGGNACITVLCFPLLPLLHSLAFARDLVLWKLLMDFAGPLLATLLPHSWPFAGALALMMVRVILLSVVVCLLTVSFTSEGFKTPLVVAWDLLMLGGAVMSCILDTSNFGYQSAGSTTSEGRRQRVLRNRLAQQVGILVGLLSSGAMLYALRGHVGGERAGAVSGAACPRCAGPEEALGGVRRYPCGTSTLEGLDDHDVVRIFHYGANMGCAKLRALGVQPLSAEAALVRGTCLRFAAAEGVPTSAEEPAFGTLEPCADGCVHGVVHVIHRSQLPLLSATEPGYVLKALAGVASYRGQELQSVLAYSMREALRLAAPSRRYAGLVYCQATRSLAGAYASQLSCELAGLGVRDLRCGRERFLPLAASRGAE